MITGITGQDGSYLAELLLEKGYEVHGVTRSFAAIAQSRIGHLQSRLHLHAASFTDQGALTELVGTVQPLELYHLAGQSDVHRSFDVPEETVESIAMGTLRLLEILRRSAPKTKLFNAGSSEVYGRPEISPQNEETPMVPVSPYGCAKAFARQIANVYREKHGLFACTGVFFNHESPRRGPNFVTRKICRSVARIKRGEEKELMLGDTSAQRDWGDARDFVRGMWLALQQEVAEDYVFATGVPHTVQDVIQIAFETAGLDWRKFVRQDPKLMRPGDTHRPLGDASKAKRLLGWQPEITFERMIREMTLAELRPATYPQPT